MLEIRRSSLSQFILSARAEIETLSNELMMSEDEKAEFGAFIDGQSSHSVSPHDGQSDGSDLRASIFICLLPPGHRKTERLIQTSI